MRQMKRESTLAAALSPDQNIFWMLFCLGAFNISRTIKINNNQSSICISMLDCNDSRYIKR
jgi:hypothetical protein